MRERSLMTTGTSIVTRVLFSLSYERVILKFLNKLEKRIFAVRSSLLKFLICMTYTSMVFTILVESDACFLSALHDILVLAHACIAAMFPECLFALVPFSWVLPTCFAEGSGFQSMLKAVQTRLEPNVSFCQEVSSALHLSYYVRACFSELLW